MSTNLRGGRNRKVKVLLLFRQKTSGRGFPLVPTALRPVGKVVQGTWKLGLKIWWRGQVLVQGILKMNVLLLFWPKLIEAAIALLLLRFRRPWGLSVKCPPSVSEITRFMSRSAL